MNSHFIKKLIALLTALALIISSMTATFAQASDYKGHWSEKRAQKLVSSGVISNGDLGKPNDKITRVEALNLLNNIFAFNLEAKENFKDVPRDAAYAGMLLKAKGEGIVSGSPGNLFKPNSSITRQDAAVIIAQAFKLDAKSESYAGFKDSKNVYAYARRAISALVDKKVLNGNDRGLLNPKGEMTKGEYFTIISALYGQIYDKPGTYTGKEISGNVIVNKPGVTLKDTVINGDLYLAQGIGQGEAYLENVDVKGRTIVSGGGENSLHFKNSRLVDVTVNRLGGNVRIIAEGATTVGQVVLQSSARLEENNLTDGANGFSDVAVSPNGVNNAVTVLNGDFNNITVAGKAQVNVTSGSAVSLQLAASAGDAVVSIQNATIGALTADAPVQIEAQVGSVITALNIHATTSLKVAASASITTLVISNSAPGTSISGSGKIATANIGAAGVTVNNVPQIQGTTAHEPLGGSIPTTSPVSGGTPDNNGQPASFTYTINYYRFDGRARNWDMWIYPDNGTGTETEFTQTTSDGFAQAVFTLPDRRINAILRPGSWSSQEATRVIEVPQGRSSVEVWIVSDIAAVYYDKSQVDVLPRINGAMMDSESEIIVSTTNPLNAGDENSFKLTDMSDNEEIPVTAYPDTRNPNSVRLVIQDPAQIDVRGYYKVSSDRFASLPVTMRRILDNPQFFYGGDDLGLTYSASGSSFKVWAPTAEKVSLALYDTQGTYIENGTVPDNTGGQEAVMTRTSNGVWSISKPGDLAGKYYMYKVEFTNGVVNYAVDPYARAVSANGQRTAVLNLNDTDPQGWEPGSKPATVINSTDSILYELHVRDFSIDRDAPFQNKGKYKAFTETGLEDTSGNAIGIDHIADLGITTVHMLPVYDSGAVNELRVDDPNYSGRKYNWGYDPVNYNVPEGAYSSNPSDPATRITEFKQMVQALHDKNIRVVMDVVYNHTYETGITPNSRFDPIVPGYFYRVSDSNRYSNGSGVNNDVATERPMVRKYILDSVKYWAKEYNIDGFRFDLLGLFDLNTARQVTSVIKNEVDPSIIIYGEPWTAASTLMDPSETPVLDDNRAQQGQDFSFFNDRFRNNTKGEPEGTTRGFATGEAGREDAVVSGIQGDIYDVSLNPREQVNYATAHDNYNLWDKILISTGLKTGGSNRNAASFDDAYTGIVDPENPLGSAPVKQSVLTNSIMLLAQGIPFFQSGDEFLRTKYGVADSYSSPDDINQITWSNVNSFKEVNDYYKGIIALRKAHPAFRMTMRQEIIDNLHILQHSDNVVAYSLNNHANGDAWKNIVVIHNANTDSRQIALPAAGTWNVVVNGTQAGTETLDSFTGSTVTVPGISTLVLYDERRAPYTAVATTIVITPAAIGLDVGGSRIMNAIVRDQYGAILYGQEITWSSADSAVAAVNNKGLITGASYGSTTVTASAGSVSTAVNVNIAEIIPSGISITGESQVAEGYSTGLSVTVRDQFNQEIFNPPVTWHSSNTGVATVNNKGLVTGVAPGTASITATIGSNSASVTITITDYYQRYLEVQYDRPDGNYTGGYGDWDLWTWNTGSQDGEYEFTETIDGRRAALIPLGPNTDRMYFIVRAGGWGSNNGPDREAVDGVSNGERLAVINMDEVYTKVVISSGVSSPEGMKTYPAAVSALSGSSIAFRYRDDSLFRNNDMDSVESVQVKVNDQVYDMVYDSANEMFTYTYPITQGKYSYTFLVTKDGTTNEVTDARNSVKENGKSVLEFYVADIDVNATVSPSAINYNQNAVLKLDITSDMPNSIGRIYVDLSSIGGGSEVSVDPSLKELTIGVEQSIGPGPKSIPVHVMDKYGNDNVTEASITVNERTASGSLDFDWDEARIYFAVIDRFYDGDTSNDDPNGLGDYNPEDLGYYHGGDLQGLIDKLDYIQAMGVNTLWISPIVDNIDQKQDDVHYGYHGYWAKDFTKVDEHFGDLDTFKNLIDAAHEHGIKIMLDVVINHVGYGMGPNDADDPSTPGYPTDEDRARYGSLIRPQNLPDGVRGGYNSGLPDFITEDPEVRAQVMKLQTDWLERAKTVNGGTIDYFRLDTVNNLDYTTLSDFRNKLAEINPEFKIVGEAFDATLANSTQLRGTGRLDSILDFGFDDLARDFVQNGQIAQVEQSLRERNAALDNTATMAQFLNSHDQTSFLVNVNNDKGMLKVAASLMITASGQPVIYYGEEYGNAGRQMDLSDPLHPILSENRKSMPWDTGDADLHDHYQKLMNIRANYSKIFAKGDRTTLVANNAARLDAFSRTYDGQTIVVALNASAARQSFTITGLPFAPGTILLDAYGNKKYVVSNNHEVNITLPAMADGGTAVLTVAPTELAILGAQYANGTVTVTFNQTPGDLAGTALRLTSGETSYLAVFTAQSGTAAEYTISDPGGLTGGIYSVGAEGNWAIADGTINIVYNAGPAYDRINVDGIIDEADWELVIDDAAGDNRYGEAGNSIDSVYSAWDADNLYLAVKADGDTGWNQGLYILVNANDSTAGRTDFTSFEWGNKNFTTSKAAKVVFAGYGNEGGYAAWSYTGNTAGTDIAGHITASYGSTNSNYLEAAIPWSDIFGGAMPANGKIDIALMFNENEPSDVAPDISGDITATPVSIDNWKTITVDADGDGVADRNKTYASIEVDGVISEPNWGTAAIDDPAGDNRYGEAGNSIDDVYSAWDADNLYLAVKADGDTGWNQGLYILVNANDSTEGRSDFTDFEWGNKNFTTSKAAKVVFAGYGNEGGYAAWSYTGNTAGTDIAGRIRAGYGSSNSNYLEVAIPWSDIFGGAIPANGKIDIALMFNENEPSDVAPDISGDITVTPVSIDNWKTITVDADGNGIADKLWN